MRTLVMLSCAVLAAALTPQFLSAAPDAAPTHTIAATDATAAWTELTDAMHPPPGPPEWRNQRPTQAERAKFYLPYVLAIADKAKDFYTKFPNDSHVFDAHMQEYQLSSIAVQFGDTDQQSRVDALEDTLEKKYSDHPEVMQMLLQAANNSEPAKARILYQKVLSSTAPQSLKDQAAGGLKKLDSVGKPVDLQFTAVDGRQVDLAKLKGKVVMIDFWATWCPPCVGEVPNVKATYDQLHPQGFEIVGISLDKSKDSLTKFTAEHSMEWPQFFDGLYWQNKYARQFGIESIPAMWLIDKKGNLRDLDGREDLSGKVKKLLAE
jgi:peroxiredoxin